MIHRHRLESVENALYGFMQDAESVRDESLDWEKQVECKEEGESSNVEWDKSQGLMGFGAIYDVCLSFFGHFFMFVWRGICDAHGKERKELQDEEAQEEEEYSRRGFPTFEEPDDEDAEEDAEVDRGIDGVFPYHQEEERGKKELECWMSALEEVDGEHAEEERSC